MRRRTLVGLGLMGGLAGWGLWPVGELFFHGWPLLLEAPPEHLPVPVPGVRPPQVADTFGAPRSGGRRHEGVDVFAPRHTPVVSTTRGVVLACGTNRLGGRFIRVLGPGGQWHYFAHLETQRPLSMGTPVRAGEVLGTVGDSGNARGTPPHLHYGVYAFPGRALDPRPLLLTQSP